MPKLRSAPNPLETPVKDGASRRVALAEKAEKKVHRFATVRPRRAFEEICDQIRADVEAGTLSPGDRLPAERELAEQFGVSRTAVREALRTLEVAGLLRCQTGVSGGSFIKQGDFQVVSQAMDDMMRFGQASVDDLNEARIHVTAMAITVACERATEADFDAIESDIERSEQLTQQGDFTRRTTYITEFYRVLARATHNPVIVMLVESLSESTRLLMAKVGPLPRPNVVKVRRKILQHLRARNAELAIAEMTRHLNSLNDYLKVQQGQKG